MYKLNSLTELELFSEWIEKFFLVPPKHEYLCFLRSNRLNWKSGFTNIRKTFMVPEMMLLRLTRIGA